MIAAPPTPQDAHVASQLCKDAFEGKRGAPSKPALDTPVAQMRCSSRFLMAMEAMCLFTLRSLFWTKFGAHCHVLLAITDARQRCLHFGLKAADSRNGGMAAGPATKRLTVSCPQGLQKKSPKWQDIPGGSAS